jgi:hypothetical protein
VAEIFHHLNVGPAAEFRASETSRDCGSEQDLADAAARIYQATL